MFALHVTIELPNVRAEAEPTSDQIRGGLLARCRWLSERCDRCYQLPEMSILSATHLGGVTYGIMWQEGYCCDEFAELNAVERDAEMDAADLEYMYPESDWRAWLESQ